MKILNFLLVFLVVGCGAEGRNFDGDSDDSWSDSDTWDEDTFGIRDDNTDDASSDGWPDSDTGRLDSDIGSDDIGVGDSDTDTISSTDSDGDTETGEDSDEWPDDTGSEYSEDTGSDTGGDTGTVPIEDTSTGLSPQDTETADTGTGEPPDTGTGYECPILGSWANIQRGERFEHEETGVFYICLDNLCFTNPEHGDLTEIESCDADVEIDTDVDTGTDTDTGTGEDTGEDTSDDTEDGCPEGGYEYVGYCYYIGVKGLGCGNSCLQIGLEYDAEGTEWVGVSYCVEIFYAMGAISVDDVDVIRVPDISGWFNTGCVVGDNFDKVYWSGDPDKNTRLGLGSRLCACNY